MVFNYEYAAAFVNYSIVYFSKGPLLSLCCDQCQQTFTVVLIGGERKNRGRLNLPTSYKMNDAIKFYFSSEGQGAQFSQLCSTSNSTIFSPFS